MYCKSCIPYLFLPEIVEHDFAKESLFSVLESRGIRLAYAKRSIEVTPPTDLENLYLELEKMSQSLSLQVLDLLKIRNRLNMKYLSTLLIRQSLKVLFPNNF
ncbi:UTRA domain-containing protein [Enterococcus sp. 079]|nr:UTRA domain-containing protein [Enterococcus sp. 079]